MSMTYTTWSDAVRRMLAKTSTDMDFAAIEPRMIEYAEGRLYRELDLLTTVSSDASQSLSAGSRSVNLPTNPRFSILQNINVITPASTAPDAGTRNPMVAVTRDFLDMAWPSATGATLPTMFCTLTDQSILVGPWSDASYVVEFVGQIVPTALSPTNPTTFLTTYLPDLFLAATMIFGTGYAQNFGAQSSDPAQAVSWEAQYKMLLASAGVNELRKKWQFPPWISSGTGTPPQGQA